MPFTSPRRCASVRLSPRSPRARSWSPLSSKAAASALVDEARVRSSLSCSASAALSSRSEIARARSPSSSAPTFVQMAVCLPEAPERDAQPQLEPGRPALVEEDQRRAEIVVFPLELLEPLGLVGPGRLRLGHLCELQEVGAVASSHLLFLRE